MTACLYRPVHTGWLDLSRQGRADVHALPGEVSAVVEAEALDGTGRGGLGAPLTPSEARRFAVLLLLAADQADADASRQPAQGRPLT